jgi:hypothetical protein
MIDPIIQLAVSVIAFEVGIVLRLVWSTRRAGGRGAREGRGPRPHPSNLPRAPARARTTRRPS